MYFAELVDGKYVELNKDNHPEKSRKNIPSCKNKHTTLAKGLLFAEYEPKKVNNQLNYNQIINYFLCAVVLVF